MENREVSIHQEKGLVEKIKDECSAIGRMEELDYIVNNERKDGVVTLVSTRASKRRRTIISIRPNKSGGGGIRMNGIGKYADAIKTFDLLELGTEAFRADLRKAFAETER